VAGCGLKVPYLVGYLSTVKSSHFSSAIFNANFVARPHYSYPLYSARIFSDEVQLLVANRETLPQLVAWCADQVQGFDSYQRVRREFDRAGIFSRGYKLAANSLPVFVLITLVKP
jgi:hypothetical protein